MWRFGSIVSKHFISAARACYWLNLMSLWLARRLFLTASLSDIQNNIIPLIIRSQSQDSTHPSHVARYLKLPYRADFRAKRSAAPGVSSHLAAITSSLSVSSSPFLSVKSSERNKEALDGSEHGLLGGFCLLLCLRVSRSLVDRLSCPLLRKS